MIWDILHNYIPDMSDRKRDSSLTEKIHFLKNILKLGSCSC